MLVVDAHQSLALPSMLKVLGSVANSAIPRAGVHLPSQHQGRRVPIQTFRQAGDGPQE